MGSDQFTFEENVFPVVSEILRRRLARHPDRDAKIGDALSVAWEMHRRAPSDVKPSSIAYYALKSVLSNRHNRESVRSLLNPETRKAKAIRSPVDVAFVSRVGGDPAKIAAFRIDFEQWLESLNSRQREIVELLILGNTTQETAEKIGCTSGNVSQYRRRLAVSWYSR